MRTCKGQVWIACLQINSLTAIVGLDIIIAKGKLFFSEYYQKQTKMRIDTIKCNRKNNKRR